MDNNNHHQLKPNLLFWEKVFSSFSIIKEFYKYFKEISINENLPLSKLFSDLFKKEIIFEDCPNRLRNIIISKNKGNLLSNPTKLFNYILSALHNELKYLEKNEEDKQIKMNEYETNESKAYDIFMKYRNNNRSFIEKLFFGVKKITKTCQECCKSFYIFKFLKLCPINLAKIHGFINLNFLYKNIQRIFEKEYFCINCNKQQKFKIKTEIVSKPNILIFVLFNYDNNAKIDFSEYLYLNRNLDENSERERELYKIKTFIMGYKKKVSCFFFCCQKNNTDINYISFGKKTKEGFFEIIKQETKKIDKKLLDKGNPYILFYKKKINKDNQEHKIDNITDLEIDFESNEKFIDQKKKKGTINSKKNLISSKASYKNEKINEIYSKNRIDSHTFINQKHNNNIYNTNIKIENDNNDRINDNNIINISKEINNKSLNKSIDYNLNNE